MSVVDDIKGRLDIVDLVSGYAPLTKSGNSYKANCPFHSERTPSFHVFPDRQTWRCFGACAQGGDIFSFWMRINNLEFGEALRQLAQQAGVALSENPGRRKERNSLHDVNEAAAEYFGTLLLSSKAGVQARAYLEERGLNKDTIKEFQIGLSPAIRTHHACKRAEAQVNVYKILESGNLQSCQHELISARTGTGISTSIFCRAVKVVKQALYTVRARTNPD